ncbi:MAG: gamma-glutamyltransferase, partial [Myxococcales bacterium]|nr:gamma-glutamyltransferase [Myxococcales bacterium]
GNAVDAAVAAKLMACVCEPMLTGLLGAGLATVRIGGRTEVLDCFADVPGRGAPPGLAPPMRTIEIDFGPDTQAFHVGPASVAVPGLAVGLWALHARFGKVPFLELAQPAIAAARKGVQASAFLTQAIALLEPIIACDRAAAALYLPGDQPLAPPHLLVQRALGDTLEAFSREGPRFFQRGDGAQALLARLDGQSRLGARDLAEYTPEWRKPLSGPVPGGRLFVPGAPSQAGAYVLRALAHLTRDGALPAEPFSGEALRRVAAALRATEAEKAELQAGLFEDGFLAGWLARGAGAGFTTHVSAVDAQGDAVGITSSLGETAGLLCPQTGLMLNNFLGEEDVNPRALARPAGARLLTMMAPSLAAWDGRVLVLGTGGSSRIRSALLHGAVYSLAYGLPPHAMVRAPRAHYEDGVLRYETWDRPADHAAALAGFPRRIPFEQPGLFFGGLHVAGVGPDGFFGAGDPRRSGAFGTLQG